VGIEGLYARGHGGGREWKRREDIEACLCATQAVGPRADSQSERKKGVSSMKVLVVYSTKTKNTLKLAEALYDTIRYRKELKSITDKPDPEDYGFIAVGFWIKDGKPDSATMEFLPQIRDKEVFLFATHASAKNSDSVHDAMKVAKELACNARTIGTFSCQGEIPAEMMEKAAAQSPQPPWLADAPSAKGHPDKKDIRELVDFFNKLTI